MRIMSCGRCGGAVGAPLHSATAPPPGHQRFGAGIAVHLQHPRRRGPLCDGAAGCGAVLPRRRPVTALMSTPQLCSRPVQPRRWVTWTQSGRSSMLALAYARSKPDSSGSSASRIVLTCITRVFSESWNEFGALDILCVPSMNSSVPSKGLFNLSARTIRVCCVRFVAEHP